MPLFLTTQAGNALRALRLRHWKPPRSELVAQFLLALGRGIQLEVCAAAARFTECKVGDGGARAQLRQTRGEIDPTHIPQPTYPQGRAFTLWRALTSSPG